MQIVKIPAERSKVLQKFAKQIEENLNVKLNIEEGDVIIEGEPYDEWRAIDIVKAIGRGFSVDSALKLLDEEYVLKIINLKEIFPKENQRRRYLARIIGTRGKVKKKIEEITGAEVCIYGSTIGIIGKLDEADLAERAVNMIIKGASHASVYFIIQKEKAKRGL
ncbi:MAG: KH domain-containing protein [Candidatus Micrarchaeia archaeon]